MGAGGLWVTRHLHMFCRRFVHKMQIQLTNFLGRGNKTNGYAGGGGALMELYFVHFFLFLFFCTEIRHFILRLHFEHCVVRQSFVKFFAKHLFLLNCCGDTVR